MATRRPTERIVFRRGSERRSPPNLGRLPIKGLRPRTRRDNLLAVNVVAHSEFNDGASAIFFGVPLVFLALAVFTGRRVVAIVPLVVVLAMLGWAAVGTPGYSGKRPLP